jgi:predicted dehydrogenase
MWDGLRINGEKYSRLYTTKPELNSGGVAFYDGAKESESDMEARLWIESILNNTEPVVKPEEALVVSEILEAIYESSETGKPVYFNK